MEQLFQLAEILKNLFYALMIVLGKVLFPAFDVAGGLFDGKAFDAGFDGFQCGF